MSRLKLPDFIYKRGMVIFMSLFISFSVIIAGTYAWMSIVQRVTNQFEYMPDESTLTITKSISDKDIEGNDFRATDEDKNFPFRFTVTIGTDESREYDYVIYGKDGNRIVDYVYPYESDPDKIPVTGSGKIKSGGSGGYVYLREGEKAVVSGVPAGNYYFVMEKNYIEKEYIDGFDPNNPEEFHFGCDNPADNHVHKAFERVIKDGWAGEGKNASGFISEDGTSEASFENTRVWAGTEISVSSLVVVDRIVEDGVDDDGNEIRLKAPEEIIDYSQPFPVQVVVGEDPLQRYYYEVVHIDAEKLDRNLEVHEDEDYYYDQNDPHIDWYVNDENLRSNFVSKAVSSNLNILLTRALSVMPFNLGGTSEPKKPIHKPSEYERRLYGIDQFEKDPIVSENNVITAQLHHQSALIIYGVPYLAPYSVRQLDYKNGIYTFHSHINDTGVVRRDLYQDVDPNYNAAASSGTSSARNQNAGKLWRTRADIFNYPPSGVKTLEIEKKWVGGSSSRVTIDILNDATGIVVDTIVLPKNGKWQASVKVPKNDDNGNEITYRVRERELENYIVTYESDPASERFTVTNTYSPEDGGSSGGGGSSGDGGSSGGGESSGGEAITKQKGALTIAKKVSGTVADRYKRFDFTVTIGKFKYKIRLADGESYTITNIPVGTKYSVSEASYTKEGYTTTSTGSSGTISATGNTTAFVNTKGEAPQSGNGSLTVKKTISGRFVDMTKKFNFTARIGQESHTFTLRHGESKTFADIPAGTSYTVTEDDYSSQDYITSIKNASGTVTSAETVVAFVNEYTGDSLPKPDDDAVQISGVKTWVHGTNTNYPASITVLVMNGSEIVTRKTVTAKENWQYAFNLPKYGNSLNEIVYTINEEPVKDYIKTINGYDLTNTYDPSQNPGTGGRRVIWIWFIVLAAGSIGLRIAVFYAQRRKGRR